MNGPRTMPQSPRKTLEHYAAELALLRVHHLDGDPTNNDLDNLIVVGPEDAASDE